MNDFATLGVAADLVRALTKMGHVRPTPIQAAAIPALLEGRDLLGLAQTGTGKTAAFALPTLQHLVANRRRPQPREVRALVLTPTRELAVQVAGSFRSLAEGSPARLALVHGGVGQEPQVRSLARGAEVLVATPGRLLDLMEQGYVSLGRVEILILDEADRMLDMGFVRDVKRITAQVPTQRQTMLFSATLPDAVVELTRTLLRDAIRVEVTPQATTAERVVQRVLFVDRADKRRLLTEVLDNTELTRVIVFTRTKHGANRLVDNLQRDGIAAEAIHGNKSQNARQRALEAFRRGDVRALVATDIAARGLDVEGISHVINYELPDEPESYVHRIGRTARAGRDGVALSFCEAEEVPLLRAIERTIRSTVDIDTSHSFHAEQVARLHSSGRGGPSPSALRRMPSRSRSTRRAA